MLAAGFFVALGLGLGRDARIAFKQIGRSRRGCCNGRSCPWSRVCGRPRRRRREALVDREQYNRRRGPTCAAHGVPRRGYIPRYARDGCRGLWPRDRTGRRRV